MITSDNNEIKKRDFRDRFAVCGNPFLPEEYEKAWLFFLTKLSIGDRMNLVTIRDRQFLLVMKECITLVERILHKENVYMTEIKLGMVEARFAEIVWQHAPLSTKELVALCEEELNWKRTTTYTVLKKLCERGIFEMENSRVTVLIGKDEFYAIQSEKFVEDTFSGSLPAFIAAFGSRKKPSAKELEEIRRIIDSFGEG